MYRTCARTWYSEAIFRFDADHNTIRRVFCQRTHSKESNWLYYANGWQAVFHLHPLLFVKQILWSVALLYGFQSLRASSYHGVETVMTKEQRKLETENRTRMLTAIAVVCSSIEMNREMLLVLVCARCFKKTCGLGLQRRLRVLTYLKICTIA